MYIIPRYSHFCTHQGLFKLPVVVWGVDYFVVSIILWCHFGSWDFNPVNGNENEISTKNILESHFHFR